MKAKTVRKGSILPTFMVIAVLAFVVAATFVSLPLPSNQQLKKFASAEELNEYLSAAGGGYRYYGELSSISAPQALSDVRSTAGAAEKSADDYSTTNIQVAGVDEADIVKNDGRYIYTLSGNSLSIVEAFPAEQMKLLSVINFSGSPTELYLSGNRLIVFSNRYNYVAVPEKLAAPSIWPGSSYRSTAITVYDITDRRVPVVERELTFNGTATNSRMIGDYVYTILNVPAQRNEPVPLFSPTQRGFPDIYYFDVPDYSYQYTNVVSLNVQTGATQNKVFLLGYSENLYVSADNLYLVSPKRVPETMMVYKILDEILLPLLPADVRSEIQQIRNSDKTESQKARRLMLILQEWGENNPEAAQALSGQAEEYREKAELIQLEIAREQDKSVIHRIALSSGAIDYKGSGEVPGRPLNQFSMDEYNGYFRIATTSQQNQLRDGSSSNNVYILDSALKITGRLEGLAKGERIYSARFIGERGYMVTFKKVDPLFVIDLTPTNPRVLGELKIPGFSDYLHPYDENHLIGIGKDTEDAGNFALFQGVKLALFDVSDVSAPKELAKTVIGDRGTDSEALQDHKAFLFSREKNLLVIPVRVHEQVQSGSGESYPKAVFQGAYVYTLTPERGFELNGKVTHTSGDDYYYGPSVIRRSLYMDDTLYTVSGTLVKATSLTDLTETGLVKLPTTEPLYYAT